MRNSECGPSKKIAVAALVDIASLIGSRPDWISVIVVLLVNWNVGP